MPRPRNPAFLTQAELSARLKAGKDFIGIRERVRFIHSHQSISIRNYIPGSVDAPLCSGRLNIDVLGMIVNGMPGSYCRIADLHDISESTSFDYAKRKHQSKQIGLVVPIVFYPYTDMVITRYAALWVGTWHHAPVLAWKTAPAARIRIQKLPSYSDLL